MTHAEHVCRSKKAWSKKRVAEAHALQAMNHPVREFRAAVPIYVYQCDVCGMWHLTRRRPAGGGHEDANGDVGGPGA